MEILPLSSRSPEAEGADAPDPLVDHLSPRNSTLTTI